MLKKVGIYSPWRSKMRVGFSTARPYTAATSVIHQGMRYHRGGASLDTQRIVHHLLRLDHGEQLSFAINHDPRVHHRMRTLVHYMGLQGRVETLKPSEADKSSELSEVVFRVRGTGTTGRHKVDGTPFSKMKLTCRNVLPPARSSGAASGTLSRAKSQNPRESVYDQVAREVWEQEGNSWIGALADASVVCSQKGTTVHVAVALEEAKTDRVSPLSTQPISIQVEYRERASAFGVIPGTMVRRESDGGSDEELLAAATVEHALMPLALPSSSSDSGAHSSSGGHRWPSVAQVTCTVLAVDPRVDPIVLAVNAASLALRNAGIGASASVTTSTTTATKNGTDNLSQNTPTQSSIRAQSVTCFNITRASNRRGWKWWYFSSGRPESAAHVWGQRGYVGETLHEGSHSSSSSSMPSSPSINDAAAPKVADANAAPVGALNDVAATIAASSPCLSSSQTGKHQSVSSFPVSWPSTHEEVRVVAAPEGIISIEFTTPPGVAPLRWKKLMHARSAVHKKGRSRGKGDWYSNKDGTRGKESEGDVLMSPLGHLRDLVNEAKALSALQDKGLSPRVCIGVREGNGGGDDGGGRGDLGDVVHSDTLTTTMLDTADVESAAASDAVPIILAWIQGQTTSISGQKDEIARRHLLSREIGPAAVAKVYDWLSDMLGKVKEEDLEISDQATDDVDISTLDFSAAESGHLRTWIDEHGEYGIDDGLVANLSAVARRIFRTAFKASLTDFPQTERHQELQQIEEGTSGTRTLSGLHGSSMVSQPIARSSVLASVTLGSLSASTLSMPSSGRQACMRTCFVHHQQHEYRGTLNWTEDEIPPPPVNRRFGRPGVMELRRGSFLESALQSVLPDAFTFPFCTRVFIEDYGTPSGVSTPMTAAGSAAVLSAATLALVDAGVPITAVPASIRIGIARTEHGKNHHVFILEPTPLEESVCDAVLSVAGFDDRGTSDFYVTTLQLQTLAGKVLDCDTAQRSLHFARRALKDELVNAHRRIQEAMMKTQQSERVPSPLPPFFSQYEGSHGHRSGMIQVGASGDEMDSVNTLSLDSEPHAMTRAHSVYEMARQVRTQRLRSKCIGVSPWHWTSQGSHHPPPATASSLAGRLPCAALVPFSRDLVGRLRGLASSTEWFIENANDVEMVVFEELGGPLAIANTCDAWGRRSPATANRPVHLDQHGTGPHTPAGFSSPAAGATAEGNDKVFCYIFGQAHAGTRRHARPAQLYASSTWMSRTDGDDYGSPQDRVVDALEMMEPIVMDVSVGERFLAEVIQVLDTGAIVRLTSAHEALLHVRDAAILADLWCARHATSQAHTQPEASDLLHPGQRVFVDVTVREKENIHVRAIAPQGVLHFAAVDADRVEAEGLHPIRSANGNVAAPQRSRELQEQLFASKWAVET